MFTLPPVWDKALLAGFVVVAIYFILGIFFSWFPQKAKSTGGICSENCCVKCAPSWNKLLIVGIIIFILVALGYWGFYTYATKPKIASGQTAVIA